MIPSLYDKFQDWCKNGSIYIISDTHFNDDCVKDNIDWIESDEILSRINKVVRKNDTLIHLGDVGDLEYMKQVKGYKVLIAGNHDTKLSKYKDIFNEIYNGPLLIGEKLLLSHEPIPDITWCLNIHGHDHMGYFKDEYHLNLSANLCDFTPISLGEYIKQHGMKNIETVRQMSIEKAIENKISKQLTGKSIYDER
jgi:calcineurin-like phosphoesterase family protein